MRRAFNSVISLAALAAPALSQGCPLQLVSRTPVGASGSGASGFVPIVQRCSVSRDGRHAVFASAATDLVAGDGNGLADIYVANLSTGTVERISNAPGGIAANNASYWPSVSADGRFIAYCTLASDIVMPDSNGAISVGSLTGLDVVVWDRSTGGTSRLSQTSAGVQAIGFSGYPEISGDGRYVTFTSDSATLDPTDTQDIEDVFVFDRQTGACSKVSVATDGSPGSDHSGLSVISDDGRYVAFQSSATNFGPSHGSIDVYVRDRVNSTTSVVSHVGAASPSMSSDGRYVSYTTATTMSAPGMVWVVDRSNGMRDLVSPSTGGGTANSFALFSRLSADGRWVAYESWASDLIVGDTNAVGDVFVFDRSLHRAARISLGLGGAQTDFRSALPAISGDGGTVVFATSATNAIFNDTNGTWDVVATSCPPSSPGDAFCFGDGPTNGGPDCPCSNNVAVGIARGCTNSTGNGGKLVATGNASLSADTLRLTGTDMAPASFSLFLQSPTNTGAAPYFFDGLRCVGPSFVRLTTKMSVAGAAAIGSPSTPISVLGGVASPGTQYYQVVYRNNAGLCNFLANSSNGAAIVWIP